MNYISINGIVTSKRNSNPIFNASVHIKCTENEGLNTDMKTDVKGRFRFELPRQYAFTIRADYNDAFSQEYFIPKNQKRAYLYLFIEEINE